MECRATASAEGVGPFGKDPLFVVDRCWSEQDSGDKTKERISMKLKVKRHHPDVQLPTYIHDGDVGMNLYSREARTLEQGEPYIFKLGFSTEFPRGHVGLIQDRSSMGAKGVRVLGGVIDPDYRGEWGVILVNTSDRTVVVQPGDKIAQVLFKQVERAEVEEADELSDTSRGVGGFGSTGR